MLCRLRNSLSRITTISSKHSNKQAKTKVIINNNKAAPFSFLVILLKRFPKDVRDSVLSLVSLETKLKSKHEMTVPVIRENKH